MQFTWSRSLLIITIISVLKFVEPERLGSVQPSLSRNKHPLLYEIFLLNDNVQQLELDVDKLNEGFTQQAEILYGNQLRGKKEEVVPPSETDTKQEENMQEFLSGINEDFISTTTKIERFLNSNNNLQFNKTQRVSNLIETFNKCLENKSNLSLEESKSKLSESLQQLDEKLKRLNVFKEKLENFNKKEKSLEEKSANLDKIMAEISRNLNSHNQYFDNLNKLQSQLQTSQKTLTDYVAQRQQHFQQHRLHHGHHNRPWHRPR